MRGTACLACGLLLALPMAAALAEGTGPVALRVPEGFTVARVAAAPDVTFPMFAAFDDRGRLFVAESSGLDLYAEIAAGTRRCRIRLLEDRDGDGRFEASTVFADRLVYPMGLAWSDGRLYVADPPELVALEDADGDGRADRRSVILAGFGHKDNGSLHGLAFGPDGRLSMTMGTPDGYSLDRGDGTRLEGTSGALIRCRPDGSRPEVVARGFVNLVEVVFTPRGEAIGTDNWFQVPSNGLRDALVHLVEGGLYPYVEDTGTPQPVTGAPLPPVARFPAVAVSGLELYRGRGVPEPWRGSLFSAQHNARKVGRHTLVPEGATFRTEDFDFVTTDDPDFHPSDVIEDADGSLLVVDTGSWYVQHCPTGRIRRSPAPGGLYRVRWGGAGRIDDPWGRSVDWSGESIGRLAGLLGGPRPAVSDRARDALAARGEAAVPALSAMLAGPSTPEVKLRAVWTLAAIGGGAASATLREVLAGDDLDVAATSARALALLEDHRAEPQLRRLLGGASPSARLAAAEALGHCGGPESLPALWGALGGRLDPFLEHAVVHAVHRLARDEDLEAALREANPRVQRAALMLLDQPPRPRGSSRPGPVVERLAADDADLRQAAVWVLRRHPEWSGQAAILVRDWLGKDSLSDRDRAGLLGVVRAFARDPGVQAVVAEALAGRTGPARLPLLDILADSPLPELPATWAGALARTLDDPDPEVRDRAVRTAATLRVPRLDAPLRRLAEDAGAPTALRLEALRAVLPRAPEVSPELFEWLLARLGDRADPTSRLAAAALLGRARLSDDRLGRVLRAARGDALLAPETFASAASPAMSSETASLWLDLLSDALDRGWKPTESTLRSIVEALPPSAKGRGKALLGRARSDLEAQHRRLEALEPLLDGGDPARGRAVFFSERVGCSACHRVGGEGREVGPDLSRVGAVRSGRDLLESLVFPGATFAQGFENYAVATTDGRAVGGVIARQTDEALVLRDASGAETRVPRRQVEEMRRLESSLMPEGLDRMLTPAELRDLLAFLRSLR